MDADCDTQAKLLEAIYIIDEMATTRHGRDVVLPALLNGVGDAVDFEAHANFSEALGKSGLDDCQTDGVAMCLAAQRFHLVQGPNQSPLDHFIGVHRCHLLNQSVDRGKLGRECLQDRQLR